MNLKEAAKAVKQYLYSLRGKAADEIAVILYNEGVREAKCGDYRKCALAQAIANKLNTPGIKVGVGGAVSVSMGEESITLLLTKEQDKFITNFDAKKYGFLQQ